MKQVTSTGGGSTLRTIRLWRDEPDDESNEALLGELLTAMSVFAHAWLEPLALAVDVACCDPTKGYSSHGVAPPAIQGWLLRTPSPGVAIEPRRIGSLIEHCEAIDDEAIEKFVHRALDQRCDGNATTGLEYISWEALRVRLPSADVTQFVVDDVNLVEIPIERRGDGDWIAGPRTGLTGSPFWFQVAGGELRFDVIWGYWLEGPGRQQVDAAINRVLSRDKGWYRAP